jgi:hypothetical protein
MKESSKKFFHGMNKFYLMKEVLLMSFLSFFVVKKSRLKF